MLFFSVVHRTGRMKDGRFRAIKEMQPEFIIPDLTDFPVRCYLQLKPGVGNRPVITYAKPEPGRLGCVISIEIGVNGVAYPVAVSQKVVKILPVSFYSPTSGFKAILPITSMLPMCTKLAQIIDEYVTNDMLKI